MMIGAGAAVQLGVGPQAPYKGAPVLVITSDAGITYSMFELDTAAKYKIPVVCVVYNNNAWGMWPSAVGTPRSMHMYLFQENLRYDKMAEGLGARGEYVRTQDEFRRALKTSYEVAAKERVSTLINVQALEGLHFGQGLSAGQHHQSRAGRGSACPLRHSQIAKTQATVALVTGILEGYAEKAVFRGFSAHPKRAAVKAIVQDGVALRSAFRVSCWTFRKRRCDFPRCCPACRRAPPMYRELRAFLKERQIGRNCPNTGA